MSADRESLFAPAPDMRGLCRTCGVNPSISGDDDDLCRGCSADEDFANCHFCHGTDCTQECEDDE